MFQIEIQASWPIIKVLKKLIFWLFFKFFFMKDYKYFFGVDVSKKTVDITCITGDENIYQKFSNDANGMQDLLQWLKDLNIIFEQTLFCMEATGLYCYTLTEFLTSNAIDTWVEHAVQIKRASGMTRGKNDKVDSRRIAVYASKHLERLNLWKPASTTLQKIRHLATLRERMVKTKQRLTTPIQEFEDVGNHEMAKILNKSIKRTLAAIEKDLGNVEAQIIKVINEDDDFKKLFILVTSVVGISLVTGMNLLIYTNGFTRLKDVRKLACYCGVAPFEHSSGSSIRGRTKVHQMANKKLKTNLYMAAMSAIRWDPEIRAYYKRKREEGKPKMSVLNAVKNKLLARVIAVVNNQRPYVKKAA